MKIERPIIVIDESLCNGCGACIVDCHENAITIVEGKARIMKESLCDGLGNCVGSCPTGALKIVLRQAAPFDEAEVVKAGGKVVPSQSCPGAASRWKPAHQQASSAAGPGHWPLKIRLVQPEASFFKNTDLVVAADCAPAVTPGFHRTYADGRPLIIGCPKFDNVEEFIDKLTHIFKNAELKSCTAVRMEVPCCRGISYAVEQAKQRAGLEVKIEEKIVPAFT